jgi:hypothetical protein
MADRPGRMLSKNANPAPKAFGAGLLSLSPSLLRLAVARRAKRPPRYGGQAGTNALTVQS